ncbi:MAG: ECF transporter S component [Clostridiaceae bacterium]
MLNISKKTNVVVKASLLLALAFILTFFELPVLPAFPWLKVDLSAVPVLLSGFAFGPLVGVGVELFLNVLVFTLKGSGTGGIGEIANFIIVGSFVFTASMIFKAKRTRKSAILGTIVASIIMIPLAMAANEFLLLPLFFPTGMDPVMYKAYMTYGLPVFNLIKGSLISVTGILFYDKISFLINKEAGFQRSYSKHHTSKIA